MQSIQAFANLSEHRAFFLCFGFLFFFGKKKKEKKKTSGHEAHQQPLLSKG